MRNRLSLIGILLGLALMVGLGGCRRDTSLKERQNKAEHRTERLVTLLERNAPMDSVRAVAETEEDVFFYVFDTRKMVYWSSNRLVTDEVYLSAYDTWRDMNFSNARTTARWTKAGLYNILAVVPIRYTQLAEFDNIADIANQTFSFRRMVEEKGRMDGKQTLKWDGRLYYSLCIALFALVFLILLVGLVRSRGFRNMRMSTRIMYIILICVLAVFIYLFAMSVQYVQRNYEYRQRGELLSRSEYIQSYLRSLYYWDVTLTSAQAEGLAIDLHDLGYDINQDIHVYSLSGELLASSSPSLFAGGLLARRMAPEVFFSGGQPAVCYEYIAQYPYLVSYVPFYNGSFVPLGYIALPYFLSEQQRNEEVDDLLARLLPPYIIVLVLALFFSYAAARTVTAPIRMMADKMRRFEIGGKDNHIAYPYHDEVGALVDRYNILVDRVENSAEALARAEREGAWRTMARQIAHEINNPLTPMKLSVQRLQLKRGTPDFDAYFDKTTKMLIAEIDNLAHIAQSFSAFAKQPEVVTTVVDIAEKLSNVITLQRANDEQIPVRYVGADSGVTAFADEEQISQVFVNIIRNAIQALSDSNRLATATDPDIIVSLNAAYSEKEVQIAVSDNGPGIPENIRARIFQPNFTTKSNGNGLGLAISKHIVEGSGGRIEFTTSPKGTTFFVYLRKN